jgi:hypothetical protein
MDSRLRGNDPVLRDTSGSVPHGRESMTEQPKSLRKIFIITYHLLIHTIRILVTPQVCLIHKIFAYLSSDFFNFMQELSEKPEIASEYIFFLDKRKAVL